MPNVSRISYKDFIGDLITSTKVKWLLFHHLRELLEDLNYGNYELYQRELNRIPRQLIRYWKRELRGELKLAGELNFDLRRLRGFLFEALFYCACLRTSAVFIDAEIAEFGGEKYEEDPPWLEATPLYDVIPPLHHLHVDGRKQNKAPQTKADFLITYADHKEVYPPALVDVKSRKPMEQYIPKFTWQIISAMRRGFIFQLAYPKSGIRHPKKLDEWEITTPCPKCLYLSEDYRKCEGCGETIFPFTIVDAIATLKAQSAGKIT